jgi:DNA helicase-2/ATP-dependent DNA helicase PcrA
MSPRQPKPPTDEQKAVLASKARVTVVRACPGAGKTEVFVEAIRQRLGDWKAGGAGLAALSFTNIARETIEARVGGGVPPPHFVGTLDSFVFRFVVKPFGHLVGLPLGAVRLFPAIICNQLEEPSVQVGAEAATRASLYDVHFCGLNGDKPVLKANARVNGSVKRTVTVPMGLVDSILEAKRGFWKNSGIVTHSDCHFIASSILRHKLHGGRVCELIARRFPVIFIDELQDTGFFLGRAFRKLFADERVSGLVVGDPDQAIYGFGGASPTIFDDFEKLPGATLLSLKLSQRCPKIVARIASRLSASGTELDALPEAIEGRATLLVHALDEARLNPTQAKALRDLLVGVKLAVISRKTATARALSGETMRDEFSGKSKAARRLNLAVQHLCNGEPREATQLVERELSRVIFEDDRAGAEVRQKKGITPTKWRAAVYQVLMAGLAIVDAETWNQWVERMKRAVKAAGLSLGWTEQAKPLRAYMKCQAEGELLRTGLLDVPVVTLWQSGDTVTTIHKVKGAEFDTVVLFVPKPSKNQCPSIQSWSDEEGGEERRIAFVAASRAKQHFVLCVHATTLDALKQSKAEFVACFQETIALPVGG